ncbi:hypothetical protein KSP40_PGU011001 [Platanthera guangdongensis]|uniref:DNA-directed RNA polymerase n=1 Tax=Platanthera guangdongensis TaxID=2320717 RepID=A0ABR2LSI9_9ASPA
MILPSAGKWQQMLKEEEILLGEISYSRYSLRSKSFGMRKRFLRPLPSASLLSQVKNSLENQPVRWVTPLGLQVVQPYYKLGRHLTHACDVDEMNIILREKFVELYEQPILENVRKEDSSLLQQERAGLISAQSSRKGFLCSTNVKRPVRRSRVDSMIIEYNRMARVGYRAACRQRLYKLPLHDLVLILSSTPE